MLKLSRRLSAIIILVGGIMFLHFRVGLADHRDNEYTTYKVHSNHPHNDHYHHHHDQRRHRKLNDDTPASHGIGADDITPQYIPSVDREKVGAEDIQKDGNKGLAPPRFAISNEVNISPQNSHDDGKWSTASDGTKIWRHRIKSPGCNSLNLGFGMYEMPLGGKLYVCKCTKYFIILLSCLKIEYSYISHYLLISLCPH